VKTRSDKIGYPLYCDAGARDFAEPAVRAAPLALNGTVAQAQAVVVKVAVPAAVLALGEQAGGGLEAAVAQQQLLRRAGAAGYRPATHRLPVPPGPPSPATHTATAAVPDRELTRSRPAAACGSNRPTWTASSRPTTVTVTGTPATVTVFFSFTVVLLLRLRCWPAARGVAGQRERAGAVLAGADLGQRAGDRLPAGGRDRQQDVAGRHEVPGRQFERSLRP